MLLCECCDIFCDFIFSDKLGNIVINKWKIGIRIKDEQYINHILHPFCWCSSTLLLRCMQWIGNNSFKESRFALMQLFWLCSSRPSEPHTRKCPSRDQACCWTPFGLGDVSAGEEGLRREIAGGKYWLTSWNFSLETEFQVEIKMFRLCVSSLPEPSLWGSNKKICQKSEANITQSWLGLCSRGSTGQFFPQNFCQNSEYF